MTSGPAQASVLDQAAMAQLSTVEVADVGVQHEAWQAMLHAAQTLLL